MSNQDSAKTVFLALSVNFFIGVIKSFVAVITSSSAMFSEAVHSFVDSFNQFLLWFGIKQSKKSNPKLYPLGRGKEEYFWTLVVAVLIFTIGGLVSLEHGIEALSHPKKLDNLFISISILTVSILLETYVLVKAVKKLRKNRDSKSILKLLKQSNDGPLIAIVVEDFAATLGLIFALIGTLLTFFTGNSFYDAASAILIGVLLMISGLFLGYEMKHLITGESVDVNISNVLHSEINKFEKVNKIIRTNLVSVGADKYLAIVHIDYLDSLTDVDIVELNREIQIQVIDIEPRFLHLYLIPA
ncbi:MAG: cation diffusion facilitator family transporter [Candidatus Actinomarinales bacterium]|nr:cation diffusion facilitator family transporter [Candidatus Actinomarinales bacterium]